MQAVLRSSVQQTPNFCGMPIFITVFTTASEWKLCGSDESSPWMESLWVRWVQSIFPHSIYLQAISNLFSFLSPTPQRIPSWEALSLSANQETSRPLLNPNIHCHLNNSLTNARLQNITTVFIYRLYSSTVGIATRYGLDGPAIESQWGEIFRTHPDRPWKTSSLKRPRRGVDHPPPPSAEVKKRVDYISTPTLGLRGLI